MKTAIIVHGMPSKKEYFNSKSPAQSNSHWIPWIQRQLILKGVLSQAPEFPESCKPVYKKWKSIFGQFKIDKGTILIGYSGGAGFLVRWLSENKIKVGKVVLVAPWIDPGRSLKTGFFNFKIDPQLVKRIGSIIMIVSRDDYRDVVKSAKQLEDVLGAGNIKVEEFTDKGHFTLEDMKTEKFPELLGAVLK